MADPQPRIGPPKQRRLYLVNAKDGIDVYSGIMKSPDAIIDQDWVKALTALADGSPKPFYDGVEIHCHGQPAEALLTPRVTLSNVDQFGQFLRRVVKPNGLIEILACEVARFDLFELAKFIEQSSPADLTLLNPLIDGYRNNNKALRDAEHEHRMSRNAYAEAFAASPPPDLSWQKAIDLCLQYDGRYPHSKENGPKFCIGLAKASKCMVRAAWYQQAQERELAGEKSPLIGNWEGFVFDYTADGLKQVYYNLERPQASRPAYVSSRLVPLSGAAGAQFLANHMGSKNKGTGGGQLTAFQPSPSENPHRAGFAGRRAPPRKGMFV